MKNIFKNFFRLNQVEKEIYQVKTEIFNLPLKLKRPVAQSVLDGLVEREKKPLLYKLDMLETERNFLISRREAFLPKTIWNLIIPVLASVITAILVTKLQLN